MTLASTYIQRGSEVSAASYNNLRSDVVNVLDGHHHGGVDGTNVEHADLTYSGQYTHAEIDTHINNSSNVHDVGVGWHLLSGQEPYYMRIYKTPPVRNCAPGTDWAKTAESDPGEIRHEFTVLLPAPGWLNPPVMVRPCRSGLGPCYRSTYVSETNVVTGRLQIVFWAFLSSTQSAYLDTWFELLVMGKDD